MKFKVNLLLMCHTHLSTLGYIPSVVLMQLVIWLFPVVSCHFNLFFCLKIQCGKPFEEDGREFITIAVKGQSFMLHQIRKMIGELLTKHM